MVGKVRVHSAIVTDVEQTQHSESIYKVTIQYQKRMRTYSFFLQEGERKTNNLLKLINVSKIKELKGKTIAYIAAKDLKNPEEETLWLLTNKDTTEFYDVITRKMVSRKKVKEMIEKLVFSEFE